MTKDKYDEKQEIDTHMTIATYILFTQMNANNAIKPVGEKSIEAMFKEYEILIEGTIPENLFSDLSIPLI